LLNNKEININNTATRDISNKGMWIAYFLLFPVSDSVTFIDDGKLLLLSLLHNRNFFSENGTNLSYCDYFPFSS